MPESSVSETKTQERSGFSVNFRNMHNPDVLSCLANLSNDEVFTPPEIANMMLDLLPADIWKSETVTFLDPACKSGVFLREIAKRLLEAQMPGYAEKMTGIGKKIRENIPLTSSESGYQKILQEKIDHIFQKQLYGIAITELTENLSRRSLYCSRKADSPYSVSKFDNEEGNIRFRTIQHTWENGKCLFCGASQSEYDRDAALETHAYELIHTKDPEDIFNMKFDVIIGNPPYHLNDGGNGSSSMPIYNQFVEQAKKLKPRYLTMIIPSRWFAGGKGLDDFRKTMLEDPHIVKMVDYVNAKNCFPGISLSGGVNYFLWDRDHPRKCEFTNIHDGKESVQLRELNEYPVFVRYNEAISIIHKVLAKNEPLVSSVVGSRNPFGFPSSARGVNSPNTGITIYSSAGTGFVSRSDIKLGIDDIDKYKVMVSKVTSEHAGEPDKSGMFKVISRAEVLKPKTVCTDSYLIAFSDTNSDLVENFYEYLCTKFFRFLLLQAVSSINLSKDKFCFVPMLDLNKKWTDSELYERYDLSKEEIDFIESMIKPMGEDK